MIKKYTYGKPFQTESVVVDIAAEKGQPDHGNIDLTAGFSYTFGLEDSDIVYGLGEANRGINKRGYKYISNNADNPHHHEDVYSLYASHNFIIVSGAQTFGLYFDYPSTITFDVGYTKCDELHIFCDSADLDIYVITGDSPYDITKQFRKMIGRSYIPPKFAFGFGQSRWGYKTPEDFETVARKYRENHIPIDMVYMDIDYMDSYKDFTINDDFGDFSEYVENLKKDNIRLIPIIDAGVKIEEGYDVYEEGVANNYFCKRADGSDFVAAVWPGYTHFPDVLNPEARRWFGAKYKILTDAGIEGFWNDMNEPAIFFTPEGVSELKKAMKKFIEKDETVDDVWGISGMAAGVANNPKDYASMYHNVDGEMVRHDKVHNLFGYNMTRAAGEALREISPDERRLLFSRSSYIGMHRYGGVWMGDNKSWWSHILLNIKMLPSMNMCGATPDILCLLVNISSHPANIIIAPHSNDTRHIAIFKLYCTAIYIINITVSAQTIANVRSSLPVTSFTLVTFANSIRNHISIPAQLFFIRSALFIITTNASIVITSAYILSLPDLNNTQ